MPGSFSSHPFRTTAGSGLSWLYTATFRHLVACARRLPWWVSCLLLAAFVALWWLLLQPIAAGRAPRGPLCGLLEFPIAALATLSSRLLESGRLAGTYL